MWQTFIIEQSVHSIIQQYKCALEEAGERLQLVSRYSIHLEDITTFLDFSGGRGLYLFPLIIEHF